jgi:multicomponent Na+:H+ antiporter subunit A
MRPRPSVVLDVVLEPLFRTALVFSLFLLLSGHSAPGGGFVGGLVVASALILRYVAGGVAEVDRVVPVRSSQLLGVGLMLAVATGFGGLVWGDAFLYSGEFDAHVPLLGEMHFATALPFDIGVYLVVIGLGLAVLRALGADTDTEGEERADAEVTT